MESLFGISREQSRESHFTKTQIDRLVEAVSLRYLEIIAIGFLCIDSEVIDNLKWEYNDDTMILKSEILHYWLTDNPGVDSKYVSLFSKSELD